MGDGRRGGARKDKKMKRRNIWLENMEKREDKDKWRRMRENGIKIS